MGRKNIQAVEAVEAVETIDAAAVDAAAAQLNDQQRKAEAAAEAERTAYREVSAAAYDIRYRAGKIGKAATFTDKMKRQGHKLLKALIVAEMEDADIKAKNMTAELIGGYVQSMNDQRIIDEISAAIRAEIGAYRTLFNCKYRGNVPGGAGVTVDQLAAAAVLLLKTVPGTAQEQEAAQTLSRV